MNAKPATHWFRDVALVLGTLGLGLLYLTAIHREAPTVKIGEIRPSMNFSAVRVVGKVSTDARVFKEGDRVQTLRFTVDDGTGEVVIQAYKAQAQAVVDRYGLPREGDSVEVSGRLGVSGEGSVSMRLQTPEQLVLYPAAAKSVALGTVNKGLMGKTIEVEGTITKIIAPKAESKAPWAITIADSSGQQELVFWQDIYDEIRDKVLLAPGKPIRARVTVRSYKDKLQLALNQGMDFEFLDTRPAQSVAAKAIAPISESPLTPIQNVTPAMVGKEIKVSGRVARVKTPEAGSKAPYEVTLCEGEQRIAVVYWDTVARHFDESSKPVVGALMTAQGLVNRYKGVLQIKVKQSSDMALVDVTPASKPQIESAGEVGMGALTKKMVGKKCTVSGELGEPKSIRGGVVYPLTDGTGSIKLVLWDKSVFGPGRDALAVGCRVVVTGKILDYKGELELVPDNIEAIRIEPTPAK